MSLKIPPLIIRWAEFSSDKALDTRLIGNKKPTNQRFVGFCPLTLLFCSVGSAERQGFEPTTLTAYISATSLSKFQIGNETVTIFRCWACPLWPLFVCLTFGFKDTAFFETRKYLIINIFGLVQGASYIYKYILAPWLKKSTGVQMVKTKSVSS